MVNPRGFSRLGLLAVGLGLAAALGAMPGIASADDIQISIDGYDLLPAAGDTATATSSMGDIAIAIGNGADANATGGIFDSAFADGAGSVADATDGNFDFASAVGEATALGDGVIGHTEAIATDGSFDYAAVDGPASVAFAGYGNGDSATVLGLLGSAAAEDGNDDLASIVSTSTGYFGDLADAGGSSPTLLGSNDIAVVVGTDSSASATASLLASADSDLAAAFGDMLNAAEIGVSDMIDILP